MFIKTVTEYFDNLAPEWDMLCSHDSEKIDWILDYAGVSSGCKVLDVACGNREQARRPLYPLGWGNACRAILLWCFKRNDIQSR